MKRRPWAILVLAPLWACASQPASNPPSASAPAAAPAATASDDSPSVLSLLATPLYIAFKIPFCVASAPIVAPGALASAIVPFKDKTPGSGGDLMVAEVKDACGPPYIANAH